MALVTSASVSYTHLDVYKRQAPRFAKAGSVLKMGTAATGLRSYLAVGGGIDTPPVLGSRATDIKCGIGGLSGRKLATGDLLPIGACDAGALWQKITAAQLDRPLRDKAVRSGAYPVRVLGAQTLPLLRAVAGPQDDAFTEAGQRSFTHSVYTPVSYTHLGSTTQKSRRSRLCTVSFR